MRLSVVIFMLSIAGLACWSGLAFAQRAPDSPASPSPPATTLSQDQIQDLIRRAAERDIENDKLGHNYTYVERAEEHKLDGNGRIKSTESKTYEVMALYGEQMRRLVQKDDKPLSAKDASKEEEKIQKLIDKRKNESDEDRKKRLEKEEKQRAEDREFVKEIADAYTFRFSGLSSLDGRPTYVIDADPRPGDEPHSKDAKFLPKFRFRAWIDQAETQWVKLDIQCVDTVSVGLFLVRIHKGSNIQIEQTQVNHEVWLPRHIALKLDGRGGIQGSQRRIRRYLSRLQEVSRGYEDYAGGRDVRTSVRVRGGGHDVEAATIYKSSRFQPQLRARRWEAWPLFWRTAASRCRWRSVALSNRFNCSSREQGVLRRRRNKRSAVPACSG